MNLLVIFGGVSAEHSISCISASHVLRNLDKTRYTIYAVGITCDGCWYLYENPDPDKIENGTWEHEPLLHAVLSPDRITRGLLVSHADEIEILPVDCVFPVLHGVGGEDGTIQGLCYLANLPCVGCGVAASALSMDKSLTKLVAQQAGVRQAAFYTVCKNDFIHHREAIVNEIEERLGAYPYFAKAARGGSSVGVAKALDRDGLSDALEECFRYDNKVIVEEFIEGHEIEVAVLGNLTPRATMPGEIAPTQEFYTFDAKYHDDSSALFIPAHISAQAAETVQQAAIKIYRALDCRGLARVDFFCTYANEEIVFNEINTMPGFTSISMYPKLWTYAGVSYPALLDQLILLAMEENHG